MAESGAPAKGGLSKGGGSTGPASSGASGYASTGSTSNESVIKGNSSQQQLDDIRGLVNLKPTRSDKDPRDPSPVGLGDPIGSGYNGSSDSLNAPSGGGVSNPYITTNERGSIEVLPTADKMFYNTVSCPCSTYLIKDSANKFGCEREYYGVKQYFKPSLRTNHFIENAIPSIGDKWACEDKTCTQSGYAFDGFYIVDVKENKSGPSSALVNSRKFTENCFIPKALYFKDYTNKPSQGTLDFLAENTVTTVGGSPVFATNRAVKEYLKSVVKSSSSYTGVKQYDHGGIKGWVPVEFRVNNKLLTSCFLDNKNIMKSSLDPRVESIAYPNNSTISASGGSMTIRINGTNNPTFSITIKDSTGCSILKEQLKNFVIDDSGEFILEQSFPAISGKTSETYDLTVSPAADVDTFVDGGFQKGAGIMKQKIYQYKNPSISIVSNTCTTCGTHTNTGTTAMSLIGEAFGSKESTLTHTSAIASSSGKLYVNGDLNFSECIVRGDVIKKVAINKGKGILHTGELETVSSFAIQDSADITYAGEVKAGMKFEARVEKVKTIFKALSLDTVPDDDCVDCDENRLIKTSKLDVGDTLGLFPGMRIEHNGFESHIVSVDCGKNLTLAHENVFYTGDTLTFTHNVVGKVYQVEPIGKNGIQVVTTNVKIPNKTELTFSNIKRSTISGTIKINKQGSSEIILTTTINGFKFGSVDTGFSLDLDSFLSLKPTARDIYVDAPKNSTLVAIDIIKNVGVNAADLTFTITKEPKSGVSGDYEGKEGGALTATRAYAPNPNFTGLDTMKYTISDGTTTSDEKTIFITVK